MAIIDIVQRSDEWFDWRKTGITASMIPVIMGLSSYQTPYQLWAEMVGLKQPDDLSNNWHVQRGIEQEPEARAVIEKELGKPFMPVCVEADHNSLFKASLDGFFGFSQQDDKEVLEIKCPHEKIYNEILSQKGQAPTFQMYAAQVQWQLNCTGASLGRLFFYLRGKKPIHVRLKRNDQFIQDAEKAALKFWELVQSSTPPDLIEGRDKEVYDLPNNDMTWGDRVNQYKEKSKYLSEIEAKAKAVKADLKSLEGYFTEQIPSDVQTFDKDGIRATKVVRNGSVDYKKLISLIEEEMNVTIPDAWLEQCKKEDCSYFRITVSDNGNEPNFSQPNNQDKTTKSSDTQQSTVENEHPDTDVVTQPSETKSTQDAGEIASNTPLTSPPIPKADFHEQSTKNVFF